MWVWWYWLGWSVCHLTMLISIWIVVRFSKRIIGQIAGASSTTSRITIRLFIWKSKVFVCISVVIFHWSVFSLASLVVCNCQHHFTVSQTMKCIINAPPRITATIQPNRNILLDLCSIHLQPNSYANISSFGWRECDGENKRRKRIATNKKDEVGEWDYDWVDRPINFGLNRVGVFAYAEMSLYWFIFSEWFLMWKSYRFYFRPNSSYRISLAGDTSAYQQPKLENYHWKYLQGNAMNVWFIINW